MLAGKSELHVFNPPSKQVVVNDGAFVEYLSVTAIDPSMTSLEFHIQGSDVDYLDLNDTYLYLKLKVTNKDGSKLDATSGCYTANYFLNSLFSDVKLYLNDTLIEGGGDMYPYKATIDSIFNFNEDSKRIQLLPAGYSDDRDERRRWIAQSKQFEVVGALRLDFFGQPKYVLSMVNMRVQLTLKNSSFSLIVPAGDAAVDPTINILAAQLVVRRSKVDESVRLGHEIGLKKQNAQYPYTRTEVVTATIPSNNHVFTKDNLLGHSQMPKFVVVGLVDGKGYLGNYDKDPFHFGTFNVQSVGLYRDGESVPCRTIYQPNYDADLYTETYFKSIILNTQHFNTNLNNGIRMEDFKPGGGYTFYTFNLAPDFDIWQRQQISDGNLRLDIKFKRQNADSINVVVYALFDDVVQITKERKVIKG